MPRLVRMTILELLGQGTAKVPMNGPAYTVMLFDPSSSIMMIFLSFIYSRWVESENHEMLGDFMDKGTLVSSLVSYI